MVRKQKNPPKTPKPPGERRWFVPEWLEFTGVSQADLMRETGWSKGRISDLVNEVERYNDDVLFAFAGVIRCPPGALVDVNPSTEEGRTLAQILLSGRARRIASR